MECLSKREYHLLLNPLIENGNLIPVLTKHNAVIAGGAIRAVYTNTPIKDYDLYFKNQKDIDDVIKAFNATENMREVFKSPTAITYRWNKVLIQVINYAQFIFPYPEDLIENFDFTVCMAAYDIAGDKLYLNKDFIKHNAQRRLVFNPNIKYPIASLFRMEKYTQKYEYTISRGELLKLCLAINRLNIKTYSDLKDQLLGIDTLLLKELTDKLESSNMTMKQYNFDEFMDFIDGYLDSEFATIGN